MIATSVLIAAAACAVNVTPVPTSIGVTQPPPTATLSLATPTTPFEVEGVLEAEGKLPDVRFFLRGDDGTRIEVIPWLPLEVVQPPNGQSAPPSMADWVGQRVRLRGQWLQTDRGPMFQVISAERAEP